MQLVALKALQVNGGNTGFHELVLNGSNQSHRDVMIVILFALWRKSYIQVSLTTFSWKESFSEALNIPRVLKKKNQKKRSTD